MIIDSPFEKEFADPYIKNVLTSYQLDYINHGDKNIREANLLSDPLAYYLEEKTGKILMPVQNIFCSCLDEINFNVWKHQVIAIYGIQNKGDEILVNQNGFGLNPNNIVLCQKDDTVKIHKSEKESLFIIFNFVFKYYNEANE